MTKQTNSLSGSCRWCTRRRTVLVDWIPNDREFLVDWPGRWKPGSGIVPAKKEHMVCLAYPQWQRVVCITVALASVAVPCSVATLLLQKSTRFHDKKTLDSQKKTLDYKRKLKTQWNYPENALQCQPYTLCNSFIVNQRQRKRVI